MVAILSRPQCVNEWLCYSGHRVALVVHRAQKSVPDSAGEWPTFLPPPLESCSGTAYADGPNWREVYVAGPVCRYSSNVRSLRWLLMACAYLALGHRQHHNLMSDNVRHTNIWIKPRIHWGVGCMSSSFHPAMFFTSNYSRVKHSP